MIMTAFLSLYGSYSAQHLATWHYCNNLKLTSKNFITKDRNTLIEQLDTLIKQSPR